METNLNRESIELTGYNDDIVVVQALSQIPGGRSLDVSGLPADVTVVKAGNVLVQDTASGAVAPLGITDGSYDALPEGKTYYGVLKFSVLRNKAMAAIVTAGQVNAKACPAPVTDDIKNGLRNIQWL